MIDKREYCKNIIGWFDFQDIYDTAVDTYNHTEFLEIGCFMGKSTAYLLSEIQNKKKSIEVSVIDTFNPDKQIYGEVNSQIEIFDSHMKVLGYNPKKYIGDSSVLHNEFKAEQFSMIFIDGAHDYESVKSDLNNYYPKLKHGGIFAGHDYVEKECGVSKAVDEFVREKNLIFVVKKASWYLIKP